MRGRGLTTDTGREAGCEWWGWARCEGLWECTAPFWEPRGLQAQGQTKAQKDKERGSAPGLPGALTGHLQPGATEHREPHGRGRSWTGLGSWGAERGRESWSGAGLGRWAMQGRELKVGGLNRTATAQGRNGRALGGTEARVTPNQGVGLGFSHVDLRQAVHREGLCKKKGQISKMCRRDWGQQERLGWGQHKMEHARQGEPRYHGRAGAHQNQRTWSCSGDSWVRWGCSALKRLQRNLRVPS